MSEDKSAPERAAGTSLPDVAARAPVLPGERQMIWTLWLTYGAFYFCRTNISAAVPGMEAPLSAGGLGLTGTQTGWILASLKIAYGVGQLFNGQLSERVSPRVLLAVGMFVSAGINVVFGLGSGFEFLLFAWALNGYVQSLGWTPCVRVVSNWVPVLRRGHAIGIIGTGYQATASLTYLVSTQSAERFGWRGALFVPSALLVACGLVMLLSLRESPAEALSEEADTTPQPPPRRQHSVVEVILMTVSNRALWLLGLSLGLLNACRYGFVDWGVAHLTEIQEIGVGKAGLQYFVLPLGGVAGAYLAGWATDRYFGGRRAPVIAGLLVVLGLLTIVYESAAQSSGPMTLVLLAVIGFCVFGPQVLLVGTAPADLARSGTAAAAAGFVNFLGYMGASAGDVVTGYYKAPEHGGWQVAIYIWAGWAFAAALCAGLLWNATANDEQAG